MNANSNRATMPHELHVLAGRLRNPASLSTTDIESAAMALQDYAALLNDNGAEPVRQWPDHPGTSDMPHPAIPPAASLRQVIGSTMAGFLGGFIAGYPMGLMLGWFF